MPITLLPNEHFLETAVLRLGPYLKEATHPTPHRVNVQVEVTNLLPSVQVLHQMNQAYLLAITGLDLGVEAGQLEVLYHFCAGPYVLTLRVKLGRETAVLPSICPIIPSATIYERELIEMFGIQIPNTPDNSHLYLPDEWPQGVYPLRKDFQIQNVQLPEG